MHKNLLFRELMLPVFLLSTPKSNLPDMQLYKMVCK